MSAASAHYGVACPKCGADNDSPCRTTTGTKRVTDTHRARINAYWRKQNAAMAAKYGTASSPEATQEPHNRPLSDEQAGDDQ